MNFKPFLAYSASAGSGKTFALAVRYISLLFMGESAGSILAATFTNKAAAEMRQRVVDSLCDLERDEVFLGAICDQTGLSREDLLARQPEVLARFLAGSSHIVTLDSFFSSILRSASLELGLEPDFITKDQSSDELEAYFLDEVQAQGLLSSLVRLAMDIEDKRFGKIFDMMQNFYKVDPLLPQMTHKSESLSGLEEEIELSRAKLHKLVVDAGASKTAVNNFAPANAKMLFGKSVFAKESLLEHRNYKKYVQNEPMIDEEYLHLKALLSKWIERKEAVVLEHIFKIYDYFKNATITHAKSSGVLTFDDLSYFTYRLLHESLSKDFLYFKIDAKFRHILLDEFQDTSTLQFLLLKPLIDEIFAGQGQSEFKSFFYVGDTKQSLYRFRGGVEELFDKVAEHYGITIEQMDTNYRSSRHVVEQVNGWFEPAMEGYTPQKSRPGAMDGYVEVVESDEIIDEAVTKAKALLELGVDVDDIAFLVSTNKDGQALQEACRHEGIPTLLKTSSSLKNVPKIAALVSMFSYLFDPQRIDAEALLIRVGKPVEQIDTSWYHPFIQPLEVLDRLVREFGYFEEDKNILKLLEFAGSFSDVPTFLEEFASSSIAVAEHSVHGAKIMTIHGSKGLEFEYVILLDKLTKKNSDKSPLIFDYNDDLYIEQIFYRSRGREHFDTKYANMIEKRKVSAQKDSKNVLYVALTRAVKVLFVIRKEKDSIFDEIGVQPMSTGLLAVSDEKRKSEDEILKTREIKLSHYGTQEVLKGEEKEEKDYAAILFGTALHYTLEMLASFDAKGLTIAMISLQNRYGQLLDEIVLKEIERRISMLISDDRFKQMFEGADVSKERSFSFKGELKQADIIFEYEDHSIVVDYKSSKKYMLKHQKQVTEYQKAIEDITQKSTTAKLVYLLEDSIEFVDV